jgi:uncharacterized hydrophobic protein (TIGR00341 family)
VFLPVEEADQLHEELSDGEHDLHGIWTEPLDSGCKLVRVLVSAGGTEAILDDLEERFEQVEGFRIVLLPVEATLPRPEVEQETGEAESEDAARLNREELYADALETARFTPAFLAMVALSTVVAAVGLMRDSPVIVLSAMVIAPLLGPNMALALATTLGDHELAKTALKSATAGLLLAVSLACLLGWVLEVDPEIGEIKSRSQVELGDIALALAAGAAGALSMTSGASGTLIGVMVAVALLPPTVVTGLLIGAGEMTRALVAAELVATNLLCLVVAAILVFLIRGIRPATWWEAEKAKRATRRSLIAGGILLVALVVLVLVQARQNPRLETQIEKVAKPGPGTD